VLSAATTADLPVYQGDDATFTIEVTNQGNVPASDIEITDYIPTGLTLNDADWTENGATAVTTITGPLAPGDSTTLDITFTINEYFQGYSVTNRAEISDDDSDTTYGAYDIDSTPDADTTNDNQPAGAGDPTDNVNDQDAINGEEGNNDEDDHDPANLPIGQIYDLALIKTSNASAVVAGMSVDFQITVTNQGTINATDVQITDYIPSGLTLDDTDWTDNGATATYALGDLDAGESATIDLTMIVNDSGDLVNRAEISNDNSADHGGDIDSTPDADVSNDNQPAGGM